MYKITRATPDELGYQDRGVVKWFGMMLSDHSEALKKEKNKIREKIEPKKKMTIKEISKVVHQAYFTGYPVIIQANVLENGEYFQDIRCRIKGHSENKICLLLQNNQIKYCKLEEIRNVQLDLNIQ